MPNPRVTIERIVLSRDDRNFWMALEKVFDIGLNDADYLSDEEYNLMREFQDVIKDMLDG